MKTIQPLGITAYTIKVGESVAYLKAWIKGWTDENLKNGGI